MNKETNKAIQLTLALNLDYLEPIDTSQKGKGFQPPPTKPTKKRLSSFHKTKKNY